MLIIFIILIFIYIFSLYKVLNWFKDNYHTIKINNILKGIPNIDISINEDNKKQDIDFKKLKEINSDIVGLIKVNNTNINYPFVHYKDNSFYLNHSLDKKYSEAGWVFLDYRNDINNLSKNNIIYAHSRLDKSMFGTLKNILNKNWYTNKDNQYIDLCTLYGTYLIKGVKTALLSDEEENKMKPLVLSLKKSK